MCFNPTWDNTQNKHTTIHAIFTSKHIQAHTYRLAKNKSNNLSLDFTLFCIAQFVSLPINKTMDDNSINKTMDDNKKPGECVV